MPVINSFIINTQIINGPVVQGVPVGSGTFVSVEQKVGFIGLGTLVSLEQTLIFRETGAGTLVDIEQLVAAIGAGTLVSLDQNIRDFSVASRIDNAGWDAVLVVGSRQIPKSEISGDIVVVRTENDSALLDVTLRPTVGLQDLTALQGKPVTLDIEEPSGTTRVFTGVVDIPDIDLINETITLRCTNRRDELINSQFENREQDVGFYSTHIFGEADDTAQEIQQRLETIPFALDFDAFNNSHLTAWQPAASADFTLTDSDIYRDSPRVSVASRGRIVNQINIDFEYRYDRNYHHERKFSWESPVFSEPCLHLTSGESRISRANIQQSADGAGWPLRGAIAFDVSLVSGWYFCNVNIGVGFIRTPIAYSTTNFEFATTWTVDEEGQPISDSNGNQLYTSALVGATDFSTTFAEKASWFGSTRWAQTVSELYTVVVSAPQSIAQYGLVEKDESHGIQAEFDSGEWEDYTAYDNQGLSSYFIDRDINTAELNEAWIAVMNRAKTTILKGHRDNRVVFQRSLWTPVDLKHTVALSSGPIDAKGKVYRIEHRLNVSSSEAVTTVELAMSRSIGSSSDTAIVNPTRPIDNVSFETSTVNLGNHFGEDPTTEAAQSWTGAIGNKFVGRIRTEFPESFVVDTPAIPDELRDLRELAANESFDVEIPNDLLNITFDGKV